MKSKLASATALALALNASLYSLAFAEVGVYGKANANVGFDAISEHASATSTVKQGEDHGNATSSAMSNTQANATSTKNLNYSVTASEHRSAVATFVQSLLGVADRDGGIGAQVRVVAMSQNDAASSSAEAMAKVKTRSAFMKFLFGGDHKNLGTIRSEIVTTNNNITKLQALADQAADASDKAVITAQIAALEVVKADLAAFVKAHEASFSLLGWTRLF